jgi:hypothetical protein
MSRNLVVHYKRVSYLIEPTPEKLNFGRRKVRIHEWEDGRVEIHCDGRNRSVSGSLLLPKPAAQNGTPSVRRC